MVVDTGEGAAGGTGVHQMSERWKVIGVEGKRKLVTVWLRYVIKGVLSMEFCRNRM